MNEDVILRPRPVVDPALPAAERNRLLKRALAPAAPVRWPSGETVTRRARLRETAVHMAVVGGAAALALATVGWYLSAAVVTIGLIARTVAFVLRDDAHPFLRVATVLAGTGVLAAVPLFLFGLLPSGVVAAVPWGVFGALTALAVADALTSRVQRGGAGAVPQGAVVHPDDLSESDHAALSSVQHTIDLVEYAGTVLGRDCLDTDRALAVLRGREWRIAVLLARQRELRRAHLRRWHRSDSPRVRQALRPQREHLCSAERSVRAEADRIVEYGRLVEQAVRAHREWERCQEAVDSTPDYAEHSADAASLDAGPSETGELALSAEAARRVRDECAERLIGHGLSG